MERNTKRNRKEELKVFSEDRDSGCMPCRDIKTEELLMRYGSYLTRLEKSKNTVDKYVSEAGRLIKFTGDPEPGIEQALRYKEYLKKNYKVNSVNNKINAVNSYLGFIGKEQDRLKTCRVQRRLFTEADRELTREEYKRLIEKARELGRERIANIIMTMGMTGMRVGELRFVTRESVRSRIVRIDCKSKERLIFLPEKLCDVLTEYCERQKIDKGTIFITRTGRPVDRKNIWAEMKALCISAGIKASKVYPHNLRHLFARCYYEKDGDLVRLADWLGHSSLETTRRYTLISSMEACTKQLELDLFVI